jgi:phenylalanyl-tRNA synthetase beta chain
MLEFVKNNSRFQSEIFMYEIGRSYSTSFDPRHEKLYFRRQYQTKPSCFEQRLLCVAYSSGTNEKELTQTLTPSVERGADFFAVVNSIKQLCWLVSSKPVKLVRIENGSTAYKAWMHPYRVAEIMLNGVNLGVVAEVVPGLLDGVTSRVVIAEIDLELLLEVDVTLTLCKPIAKYPDSFFEMSVVADSDEPYAEIEKLLLDNIDLQSFRKIEPIAVYQGKPLNENEKSVSVKLSFGSDERTLSHEEMAAIQNRLIEAIKSSKYSLRG